MKIIAFIQRIGFGILLGLVQLGLVFLGIPRFNPTPVIILGLILYLVIPGLAGLMASRQREHRSTGVGFVTGITCAIIIMFVLSIVVAIALNTPAPTTSGKFVPLPVAFVVVYFTTLALFLNFLGVLLAIIGGWLGGLIGKIWAIKPAESSRERHRRNTAQAQDEV